ncbi:imidazolonepropionase [compost metagenome]
MPISLTRLLLTAVAASALAVGAQAEEQGVSVARVSAALTPFASTYAVAPSPVTAIINANILTGTGAEIRGGGVLLAEGRIVAVGFSIEVPSDARVIDAGGRWVTPGVIDAHSHLGVMPGPRSPASMDVNENVNPNTAEVWAEHSVWPQDAAFDRARAGGVTSLLILPGSANLFGGRSVVLRNVGAATTQAMKFPNAPYALKMACGENPKLRYGSRGRSPATRMGNVAGYRRGWIEAADYARRLDAAERRGADAPRRDLSLETLAGVLSGDIGVQAHCYRADEMAQMVDVAHEFGYRITAFHHAVEAYKIADLLAREDICVATWAGRWGFKLEAADAIEENAAVLTQAGVCVAIHSDDPNIVQRLNLEAAVALSAGRRAGINISEAEAIKWITANPARIMGIQDETGTLEAGKRADVVLWSTNPFSVYAVADQVIIDGVTAYDRADPTTHHTSDFEIGQPGDRS